jgi:hypothetical protein
MITARALRVLGAAGLVCGLLGTVARPAAQAVSVTIPVTALAPGYLPAVVSRDRVSLTSGHSSLTVTGWARLQAPGDTLQLAILIDSNVRASLAGQPLQDLAAFVKGQPATASIGVFFADKGKATEAADFSTNHQASADALAGASDKNGNSLRVYPSLSDLASHWPTPPGAFREILMIGSGYDVMIGDMEDPNVNAGTAQYAGSNYDTNVSGERDPYLNSMIESVQRAGITVHSIYVPDPRFEQMVQANIMRDKLVEVSTETGGLAYFNGNYADSFSAYLRQLNNALRGQYLLTFSTDRSHKSKGELRGIQVKVNQADVTVYAPRQVFVPGS